MSEYPHSKDSASQSQGKGRHAKEHMKRGNMRPMKQQQCMNISKHSCIHLFTMNISIFTVSNTWSHHVIDDDDEFNHFLPKCHFQLDKGEEAEGADQEGGAGCSTRERS